MAAVGKADRDRFLKNLPALGRLVDGVRSMVAKRGFLVGLDGRQLRIRSEHAALNTLLQSAGAVIMKKALVLLDEGLINHGYKPGEDYEFLLNIHDEWQIECRPEIADRVGEFCVLALEAAGDALGFRCPITGQYQIGNNWAETH